MKLQEADNIGKITGFINRFTRKNSVSNNYLLPAELNSAVEDSKLLYCNSNSNLYLFLKKTGGFLRLYYILNDLNEIPTFDTNIPLMTEILFRGNTGIPEKEITFLQSIGFRVNIQRDQYSAMASGIEGLPPTYTPSIEMTKEAVQLFNSSFDKFSGDFIPLEEADSLYNEHRVLCIMDDFNGLKGALQFTITGKNTWISHVAVNSQYRRQGVANRLLKMFAQIAKEKGAPRLMLWVQTRNDAAVALYSKYGFKYLNKSSISLIKEE